jgi:hypothetical protein
MSVIVLGAARVDFALCRGLILHHVHSFYYTVVGNLRPYSVYPLQSDLLICLAGHLPILENGTFSVEGYQTDVDTEVSMHRR